MKTGARHTSTQEETELGRKREELEALKKRLARLERLAAKLRVEIGTMGRMYATVLAPKVRERDELERLLSRPCEFGEEGRPAETFSGDRFSGDRNGDGLPNEPAPGETRTTETGMSFKDLYRRVAKAIHPDLSTDEEEKKWRQELMVEANNAYSRKDRESLRAILRQWERGPESRPCRELSAELAGILRKISWLRERIRVVEDEIREIQKSDLYRLLVRVEKAHSEGVDLFGEIVAQMDEEIRSFRERLEGKARTDGSSRHRRENSHKTARKILFPGDKAVGKLFIRDRSSESFLDWRYYLQAMGTVEIPSGKSLRLDIQARPGSSLSFLGTLGPDDLQALFLHGSRDTALPHVQGLTGLHELYLSGKGITDAGMGRLPALENLARLYLYDTAVTDRCAEILTGLNGLRCITFCGTGMSETALRKLTASLPGCRVTILNRTNANFK